MKTKSPSATRQPLSAIPLVPLYVSIERRVRWSGLWIANTSPEVIRQMGGPWASEQAVVSAFLATGKYTLRHDTPTPHLDPSPPENPTPPRTVKNTEEKPNHELAREELRALYSRHCPPARIISHGCRTDSEGRAHNEFTVHIAGERFDCVAGFAGAPEPAEVLARCCAEALGAQQSFASWCHEYVYNADSIRALNTYLARQNRMAPVMAALRSRALVEQFAALSYRLLP